MPEKAALQFLGEYITPSARREARCIYSSWLVSRFGGRVLDLASISNERIKTSSYGMIWR